MQLKKPLKTPVFAFRIKPPRTRRASQNGIRERRVIVSMLLAGILILMSHAPVPVRGAAVDEYAVKAAVLVKFTQYVTWPATAFSGADAPFSIGVLGDDPLGANLTAAAQNATVGAVKRKIVIKRSKKVEDLKDCQIVFVSKSERAQLATILAGLGQANVLTVGELEGFAAHGGVVNFYIADDDTVKLEINIDVAGRQGLAIDSRLLKMAKIVH